MQPKIKKSFFNISINIIIIYKEDKKSLFNISINILIKFLKLLGSTKSKLTKDRNGENVPYLEITDVVLIHCNAVNNSYQQNSRALYTFVPNKSFCQLLDISPKNFMFLKTFISEF